MSWTYKRYVVIAGPTEDPAKFLTVMKKSGTNAAMTFTGPTQEAVQGKIDKFWADEAEKAGKRAAGRVKTAAAKAREAPRSDKGPEEPQSA